MTTARELNAETECADLRRANAELQRQNDILVGRCSRLNGLIVDRDNIIDAQAGVIEELRADLAALNETCDRIARAGMREVDARDLGY